MGIRALKRAESDISAVIGGDRLDTLVELLSLARDAGIDTAARQGASHRRRRS